MDLAWSDGRAWTQGTFLTKTGRGGRRIGKGASVDILPNSMTVLDAMLLLNAAVGLLGALYVLWPWEAV